MAMGSDKNKSLEFYETVLQFKYKVQELQSQLATISVPSSESAQKDPSSESAQKDPSSESAQKEPSSECAQKDPSSESAQKDPSSDEVPIIGIEKVKKKGVVIGINEYQYLPNRILRGAQNDAAEVYTILQKNGFEISHEHYLQGNQATYRAISKAISDTLRKPANYDIVVFYFSGHGFTDESNGGYLAPYDIDPEDLYVCGIRSDELFRVMDDSANNSKFVVLLDCCYSGNVVKDSKSVVESDIESSKGAEILVNKL